MHKSTLRALCAISLATVVFGATANVASANCNDLVRQMFAWNGVTASSARSTSRGNDVFVSYSSNPFPMHKRGNVIVGQWQAKFPYDRRNPSRRDRTTLTIDRAGNATIVLNSWGNTNLRLRPIQCTSRNNSFTMLGYYDEGNHGYSAYSFAFARR
jgi:hypothetical protein